MKHPNLSAPLFAFAASCLLLAACDDGGTAADTGDNASSSGGADSGTTGSPAPVPGDWAMDGIGTAGDPAPPWADTGAVGGGDEDGDEFGFELGFEGTATISGSTLTGTGIRSVLQITGNDEQIVCEVAFNVDSTSTSVTDCVDCSRGAFEIAYSNVQVNTDTNGACAEHQLDAATLGARRDLVGFSDVTMYVKEGGEFWVDGGDVTWNASSVDWVGWE